jgi:hypothetical protein
MILGPDFYTVLTLILCYLLLVFARAIQRKCRNKCTSKLVRILSPMFSLDAKLRVGLQLYIVSGLAGLLNLHAIVTSNLSDWLSLITAILCLSGFIGFPIVVAIILIQK